MMKNQSQSRWWAEEAGEYITETIQADITAPID